jgi:hypothetical protein
MRITDLNGFLKGVMTPQRMKIPLIVWSDCAIMSDSLTLT